MRSNFLGLLAFTAVLLVTFYIFGCAREKRVRCEEIADATVRAQCIIHRNTGGRVL